MFLSAVPLRLLFFVFEREGEREREFIDREVISF